MFPQAAPVGSEGDASRARRRFRRSDSESSGSSESDFRRFWLPTFEKKLTRLVPRFFSTSRLFDFSQGKATWAKIARQPSAAIHVPHHAIRGPFMALPFRQRRSGQRLAESTASTDPNGHRAGWASGLSKGLAEMKHRPGPEDCCSLRVITLIAPVLLVS